MSEYWLKNFKDDIEDIIMKQNKMPVVSHIHRNEELAGLQLRIPVYVKADAENAAVHLGTSMNRLVEAAIIWYLEALKKEGSL